MKKIHENARPAYLTILDLVRSFPEGGYFYRPISQGEQEKSSTERRPTIREITRYCTRNFPRIYNVGDKLVTAKNHGLVNFEGRGRDAGVIVTTAGEAFIDDVLDNTQSTETFK
jgi:hypothetical protein